MFKKKAEGGAFQDGKVGEMEVTNNNQLIDAVIILTPDEWDDCGIFHSTGTVTISEKAVLFSTENRGGRVRSMGGFLRATTVTGKEIFRLVRKRRGHGQFRTYGSNI